MSHEANYIIGPLAGGRNKAQPGRGTSSSTVTAIRMSEPTSLNGRGFSFAYLLPRARNDTNRKPLNREICNFLREKTMTTNPPVPSRRGNLPSSVVRRLLR